MTQYTPEYTYDELLGFWSRSANDNATLLAQHADDQERIAALVAALAECADVLGKLMQSARIEGRTEAENYARHGNEVARDALVLAKGE